MKEYTLHATSVKHIRSAFPNLFFFHVPNQSRDATEAFFNKEMGAKAGVSDLIFAWEDTFLPIGQLQARPVKMGAIELKLPKGRESHAQNVFRSVVQYMGWHYAICRSVKEVHEALKSWGHIPKFDDPDEPHDKKDRIEMSKQWTQALYKKD